MININEIESVVCGKTNVKLMFRDKAGNVLKHISKHLIFVFGSLKNA